MTASTGDAAGQSAARTAIVAGTFDTKGPELAFLGDRLRALGIETLTVDLSTSGVPGAAQVGPREIAAHHPEGAEAVFAGERGRAVTAMALAFERWIAGRTDIGGIVGAGGSGATALVTPAMRRLPIGIPKVMVSTVAAGDVGPYVGQSDILMMYPVVDVQGLNSVLEQILRNAAAALAGMMADRAAYHGETRLRPRRPAVGLTMFGVTTPCVQMLSQALEPKVECLVFHATGAGGRAMEGLVDAGQIAACLDVTTTEVADMLVGGVLPATPDRLGAFIRRKAPYVGSLGACDMVNFGSRESVPSRFEGRRFVVHNPQVTLMRTTPEENRLIGEWIGARLNEMEGPVRFLIPEGGVSLLDLPGKPFHDPAADAALFEAVERTVVPTPQRQVRRVAAAINEPAFASALADALREIFPPARQEA